MNKAITKRLLSLVLLVVMLVGCALPAYAADTGASGDLTAVYAQEGTVSMRAPERASKMARSRSK